ncbi:MAG: sodium-extruding oxaloacetate decarboxylase subunit alpha [Gammaproteobacteria bacterium]|nr:sodium-extruding oxaloacetate decarboxylase subunit alpha [Gammaproteobacteria bacterium]
MSDNKPGITEVVLRDAHQSLFATRMRVEDMLPIASKLDQVGYWSLESWGGATFDACIRFLGEDPWERLRLLKAAMPNTPQQMLLRGQNLLGYRHYADDVVEAFVERAAETGIDVFRIFDAMNDPRNLETAVSAALKSGKHAQGTISYTTSPVHSVENFVEMGRQLEEMGCHSICIKDMAGLLNPYTASELVSGLKQAVSIPLSLHSHATTGMSTVTIIKAIEAGVDVVDSAISSMSMTYSHSATESLVAILQQSDRDSGLDLLLLQEIADYFREVRKKYAHFEGSLRGVDSRILNAQVPGGMLTNMESQLREQNAVDRFADVLDEIPRVREDLGFIPLVTPTSQIVGTQAVLNVLSGERYKTTTRETEGILRGEYGASPGPLNSELQQRVLDGKKAISCRPADLLKNEIDTLSSELKRVAAEKDIELSDNLLDDVLIYAQFPKVGLHFLENRHNPEAFEPPPEEQQQPAATHQPVAADAPESYQISVNGVSYDVVVAAGGSVTDIQQQQPVKPAVPQTAGEVVSAPLTGTVYKINIAPGQQVHEGDIIIILEAMKMETEIRSPSSGVIDLVNVREGDKVQVGDPLLTLSRST